MAHIWIPHFLFSVKKKSHSDTSHILHCFASAWNDLHLLKVIVDTMDRNRCEVDWARPRSHVLGSFPIPERKYFKASIPQEAPGLIRRRRRFPAPVATIRCCGKLCIANSHRSPWCREEFFTWWFLLVNSYPLSQEQAAYFSQESRFAVTGTARLFITSMLIYSFFWPPKNIYYKIL